MRSISARGNNASAKARDGSCLGCSRSSRVCVCVLGGIVTGGSGEEGFEQRT